MMRRSEISKQQPHAGKNDTASNDLTVMKSSKSAKPQSGYGSITNLF